MMKNSVAVNSWLSHFVIAPPLIIERTEIDAGVAALDEALALADRLADR
jgi:taurine--2-oxoglutarate transaminase